MVQNNIVLVNNSYGRCLVAKKGEQSFLDAFYDAFLASDKRIGPMFEKTDFSKQKELLKHGLSMLLMFVGDSAMAKSAVARLSKSHDHEHMNIHPTLYIHWENSLLKCVEKYDPDYSPALGVLWREAISEGIAAMKKAY